MSRRDSPSCNRTGAILRQTDIIRCRHPRTPLLCRLPFLQPINLLLLPPHLTHSRLVHHTQVAYEHCTLCRILGGLLLAVPELLLGDGE